MWVIQVVAEAETVSSVENLDIWQEIVQIHQKVYISLNLTNLYSRAESIQFKFFCYAYVTKTHQISSKIYFYGKVFSKLKKEVHVAFENS
jgi:hypothetical protein